MQRQGKSRCAGAAVPFRADSTGARRQADTILQAVTGSRGCSLSCCCSSDSAAPPTRPATTSAPRKWALFSFRLAPLGASPFRCQGVSVPPRLSAGGASRGTCAFPELLQLLQRSQGAPEQLRGLAVAPEAGQQAADPAVGVTQRRLEGLRLLHQRVQAACRQRRVAVAVFVARGLLSIAVTVGQGVLHGLLPPLLVWRVGAPGVTARGDEQAALRRRQGAVLAQRHPDVGPAALSRHDRDVGLRGPDAGRSWIRRPSSERGPDGPKAITASVSSRLSK